MKLKMSKPKRSPQPLSAPQLLHLPPSNYQPSKAEREEEITFPNVTLETMRRALFRPFVIHRRKPKSA